MKCTFCLRSQTPKLPMVQGQKGSVICYECANHTERTLRQGLVEGGLMTLACSFCHTPQEHAEWLVAGDGVHICAECSRLAVECVEEQRQAQPSDPEAGLLRCSFCAKAQLEVEKLIAGPEVHICDECVVLCHEILADQGA